MNATLHLPKKKVNIHATWDGESLVITDHEAINFQISGLLEVIVPEEEEEGRLWPGAPDWEWLTPSAVIEYFRRSAILSPMAEDVERILAPLQEAAGRLPRNRTARDMDLVTEAGVDTLALFDQSGAPVWGAQSVIAKALGVPNAGNYRDRISRVMEEIAA